MHYQFTLERDPALRVRIQLQAPGSERGTTTFEVSREWGGVNAGGEDIADVRITNARGATLAVQHPEPHRWHVDHPPGEMLVVEYAFAPNAYQEGTQSSVNRRPILNPNLFHAYGTLALLTPMHLESETPRRMELRWKGFEAAGWKVATSFGVGENPDPFEATISELHQSVLMAGECELVERSVDGRPVWVALARADWSFTASQLADLVQKVVAFEREFFRDPDHPYYLVTAIPIGVPDANSRSFGGTGLSNSFALAMFANTPLENGPGLGLAGLLMHEYFHEWNGQTLRAEEPETLVYWWTEGFTDFFTRRLLYRSGLIDRAGYVVSLNEKLRSFQASPVRNAPNERIRSDFWRHDEIHRLPYVRGDLVAMLADAAIRRHSNGAKSLDDLMRDLIEESRRTRRRFDAETLLRRIEDMTNEKDGAALRAMVVDGVTPEIDARTLEPCLQLQTVDIGPWDLGFDFTETRTQGKLVGVHPDSQAYKAGLRDGQQIRGWSVHLGDPSKEVELTLQEGETQRKVRYLPQGRPTPTPQFSERPAASQDDCRCL